MPKSHSEYVSYTPELIAELKALVKPLTRPEGVKALGKKLGLSERQARRVFAERVEEKSLYRTGMGSGTVSFVSGSQELPIARPIRRLFLDLEVSPNTVLSWRIGYKININHDSIIKERAIICAAWKFQGDKKVKVLTWDKNQDDKALLIELCKDIEAADEIIYQNGDKFDLPWVRTKCIYHDLPPFGPKVSIDTLKIARSKFYFNSNKLDYIAKYLGLGSKLQTGYDLWKNVLLHNCKKSLDKMCEYCCHDVEILEKVYDKLVLWVPAKTHVGVLGGGEKWTSPYTGTTNVKVSKTKVTAAGVTKYQMQDLESGQYYTISTVAHQAYLEAKK